MELSFRVATREFTRAGISKTFCNEIHSSTSLKCFTRLDTTIKYNKIVLTIYFLILVESHNMKVFFKQLLQTVDPSCINICNLITHVSEKAMAPYSSTLAWKIPWMEESGGLQSMESLRVGHDWATSLSLFTFMHWRRKWQPTPVLLPGESQGWGAWWAAVSGVTASDTTEVT